MIICTYLFAIVSGCAPIQRLSAVQQVQSRVNGAIERGFDLLACSDIFSHPFIIDNAKDSSELVIVVSKRLSNVSGQDGRPASEARARMSVNLAHDSLTELTIKGSVVPAREYDRAAAVACLYEYMSANFAFCNSYEIDLNKNGRRGWIARVAGVPYGADIAWTFEVGHRANHLEILRELNSPRP